jgi:hypothetical protein
MPGLREQFQYYADGRLQTMTDLDDRNQDIGYPDTARHFSRVQSYDQVGRLTASRGTPSNYSSFPYDQSYGYDAFGNSTSRGGWYYYQNYSSDGGNFQNNRRQDFNYDPNGKVTHSPSYNYVGGSVVSNPDWTYDAAGRMSQVKETVTANSSVSTYISNHDGDGQPAIEYYQENPASKSYMVRSSVLGGKVLTRLDYAGNKWKTDFSVDGLLRVVQYGVSYYNQNATLQWTHIDPLGLSEAGDTKAVYDPTGNYIQWQHAPTAPPNAYPPIASSSGGLGAGFGSAQDKSCVLNGEPISCSDLEHQTDTGNVAVDYLIMDSQGLRHVQGDVTSNGLGLVVVDYPKDNQDGGYELLHKIVTLPQNSLTGQHLHFDPCAHLLPQAMPDRTIVDRNMKTAADELQAIKKDAHMGSGDLGGRAAEGPTIAVNQLLWYENAMREYGPYDYKRMDPVGLYDELGNFNYGAMGIAFEFTQNQLERMAGYIRQNRGKHPEAGRGIAPSLAQAVLGVGGNEPFGDKPESQEAIKRGIEYAHCRGY